MTSDVTVIADGTPEQWAVLFAHPVDPAEAVRQRRQDARNRGFAHGLVLHPGLKAALLGIADDTDGLLAVWEDTGGDLGERTERGTRLAQSLKAHTAAARNACV